MEKVGFPIDLKIFLFRFRAEEDRLDVCTRKILNTSSRSTLHNLESLDSIALR